MDYGFLNDYITQTAKCAMKIREEKKKQIIYIEIQRIFYLKWCVVGRVKVLFERKPVLLSIFLHVQKSLFCFHLAQT